MKSPIKDPRFLNAVTALHHLYTVSASVASSKSCTGFSGLQFLGVAPGSKYLITIYSLSTNLHHNTKYLIIGSFGLFGLGLTTHVAAGLLQISHSQFSVDSSRVLLQRI